MKKINHPRPVKNTSFDGYKQGKQLRIMTVSNCSSNNPTSPELGFWGGSFRLGVEKGDFVDLVFVDCFLIEATAHPLKMSHSEPKGTHGGLESQ